MKKFNNTLSPFIMLLVPLFLLLGLLALNVNNEIPADKLKANTNLQVPTIKSLIQASLK